MSEIESSIKAAPRAPGELHVNGPAWPVLFEFVTAAERDPSANHLQIELPFEALAASPGFRESWQASGARPAASVDGFACANSEEYLVLCAQPDGALSQQQVERLYTHGLEIARDLGKSQLIRTWNFFPDINAQQDGLEVYQRFCIGRAEAIARDSGASGSHPAATAIGTLNRRACYVFLFARVPAQGIENTRQMPAWEYPQMYSPRQPLFSRAVLLPELLLCSGTASVTGHATQHVGRFEKQYHESLANIAQLLHTAGLNPAQRTVGVYKFYLRDAERLPQLIGLLSESALQHWIVLHGEVCRRSLMLECEAVFSRTGPDIS